MPQSAQQLFADDYQDARRRFLEAARSARCELRHFQHESLLGPDGGTLAVDVARLGAANARRVLLIVSGTHGVEGFMGSGAQCGVLRDGLARDLPADAALVLVHAINPDGFAYERRVTSQNIDLNRNFISHDRAAVAATAYELLHPAIMDWDGVTSLEDEPAVTAFIRERGPAAFQSALTAGQRTHPDGLFYAGREPCWSNRIWRTVVRTYAADVERLVIVDLHTGLGDHGNCELLLLEGEVDQAAQLFGAPVRSLVAGATSASSAIAGTLIGAAPEETSAQVAGIALEIGTVSLMEMLDVLRAEHWLRFRGAGTDEHASSIKRRMRETFYVESDDWKESAWRHVRTAIAHAVAAL